MIFLKNQWLFWKQSIFLIRDDGFFKNPHVELVMQSCKSCRIQGWVLTLCSRIHGLQKRKIWWLKWVSSWQKHVMLVCICVIGWSWKQLLFPKQIHVFSQDPDHMFFVFGGWRYSIFSCVCGNYALKRLRFVIGKWMNSWFLMTTVAFHGSIHDTPRFTLLVIPLNIANLPTVDLAKFFIVTV